MMMYEIRVVGVDGWDNWRTRGLVVLCIGEYIRTGQNVSHIIAFELSSTPGKNPASKPRSGCFVPVIRDHILCLPYLSLHNGISCPWIIIARQQIIKVEAI